MPASDPSFDITPNASFTSLPNSSLSAPGGVSSQMGFTTLMQYLQKQKANMGFELAKSSPVVRKGRCLAIISIFVYEILQFVVDSMIGLAQAIYHHCYGSDTYNICILGIQQTGKTALFSAIKGTPHPASEYKPTVGLNMCRYRNDSDRLVVWDLGGKATIRKIWENYYSQCHGVIYMINDNIAEGIDALKSMARHQQMARIPILVIVLKEGDRQCVELMLKNSDFMANRKYVIHCIAIPQIGSNISAIKMMLHWLYDNIKQLHDDIRERGH